MFIKFGDKTKRIIVKNSKEKLNNNDIQEENTIYLDSEEEDDRRIKALREYSSEDSKENKP